MAREQRKLAAIVAADVVGYSRLMGRDESGTLARLRQNRSEHLDPVLTKYGGRLVKLTGDGALVEFASAVDALSAAIEFQQAMAEANSDRPADTALVFRMGLHLGDLIVDGDDLYGDGVNVAARLEGEAPAGGIVISRTVHEAVAGRVRATFDDLGGLALKNIERSVQAFAVKWESSDWQQAVTAEPIAAPATVGQVPLPLPDKPSIAVLPFQNMSSDPEQEYFADGMVEEIITALSRFKSLFVIARNSSFTYKGKSVDIKQVGRELGVRYVLEGSVRKAGDRVRITGQLIESQTGTHLWADRFDGSLEDIFGLQDQMTNCVVGAVAPKLGEVEIDRAKRKSVENLDAYDIFLRGMARMHELNRASFEEALGLFYRAIELDPSFSTPYGMVARCHAYIRGQNWSTDRDVEVSETRRMAERLAVLGSDDALALCSAGYALVRICNDDSLGIGMIDQALALNQNLAVAWTNKGAAGVLVGQHSAAIEPLLRALRLSPLDPEAYFAETMIAIAHSCQGNNAEALEWTSKALARRPDYMVAFWVAAICSAFSGNFDTAGACIQRVTQLNPGMRMSNLRAFIPFRRSEDVERTVEGTRLAGLPE